MGDSTQLLSRSDCEEVLKKLLGTKSYVLHDFAVLPFDTPLDGLIGEHFRMRIDYSSGSDKKSTQFFVKALNRSNGTMFDIAKSIFAFEKEEFFYTTLLEDYKRFNIDTSFAPEGYFFKPYVTVLQDVAGVGYKGTKKREPFGFEHCKAALEAVAAFHSSSIAYEEARSNDLGREYSLQEDHEVILEDKVYSNEDTGGAKYLKASIQGLFQLIDVIPSEFGDRDEFKSKLSEALEEMLSSGDELSDLKSTVVHDDLWSSNFLFKCDEDGKPVTAKLVDYQTIKYGPPQLDVMKFFMTNTRRSFRERNMTELLEHYYDALVKPFDEVPFGLLSKKEFVESCEIFRLPAKIHGIIDRSITGLPDELFMRAMQSDESFAKFIFEERGKHIMATFNSDKNFKNILLEDALELKELLFS